MLLTVSLADTCITFFTTFYNVHVHCNPAEIRDFNAAFNTLIIFPISMVIMCEPFIIVNPMFVFIFYSGEECFEDQILRGIAVISFLLETESVFKHLSY